MELGRFSAISAMHFTDMKECMCGAHRFLTSTCFLHAESAALFADDYAILDV